jgi:very-short-patch-repair endonuclease
MSDLVDDLIYGFNMAASRRPFAERITKANTPGKWSALKEFYGRVAEFDDCEPWRWAINPYEVDWLRVFTPIEYALWCDIRGIGAVLYPQFPVGRYFVDFGNPGAKVAIECDGAAYHTDIEKDARRDEALRRMGWTVYRIPGRDCFTSTEEVTNEDGATEIIVGRAESFVREIANRHGLVRRAA